MDYSCITSPLKDKTMVSLLYQYFSTRLQVVPMQFLCLYSCGLLWKPQQKSAGSLSMALDVSFIAYVCG